MTPNRTVNTLGVVGAGTILDPWPSKVVLVGRPDETEELAATCAGAGLAVAVAAPESAGLATAGLGADVAVEATVWPIERKRAALAALAAVWPPEGPLLTCCLAVSATEAGAWVSYRPAPLLRRLVLAGRLGRRTGAGFYEGDSSTDR